MSRVSIMANHVRELKALVGRCEADPTLVSQYSKAKDQDKPKTTLGRLRARLEEAKSDMEKVR